MDKNNFESLITEATKFSLYCYLFYENAEAYKNTLKNNPKADEILTRVNGAIQNNGILDKVFNVCNTDQNQTGFSCKDAEDAKIIYESYVAMNSIVNEINVNLQMREIEGNDNISKHYNNIYNMKTEFVTFIKNHDLIYIIDNISEVERWYKQSHSDLYYIYQHSDNQTIKDIIKTSFDKYNIPLAQYDNMYTDTKNNKQSGNTLQTISLHIFRTTVKDLITGIEEEKNITNETEIKAHIKQLNELKDSIIRVIEAGGYQMKFGKAFGRQLEQFVNKYQDINEFNLSNKNIFIQLYGALTMKQKTETYKGLPMMRKRY